MEASEIKESFVRVNNVETSVIKYGAFDVADARTTKVVFLLIPGNPGVPAYYEDFMRELYQLSHRQIPVWAVGHAGHVQHRDQALAASHVFSTNEDVYGLEAQIEHKITFIKENIPSDVSVILVGHSIGCYMILNMLRGLPDQKVLHCFMLFPTIERMAVSPNGLSMTPMLNYLRWVAVLVTLFLSLLPEGVLKLLISLRFKNYDYPPCFVKGVIQTVTPWTANFTTYLAKIEMNKVTDIQMQLVKKYHSKLSLYYGASDGWTPVKYYEELKEAVPEADAQLCTHNYKHAFVQETAEGRAMAGVVWQWARGCDNLKHLTT